MKFLLVVNEVIWRRFPFNCCNRSPTSSKIKEIQDEPIGIPLSFSVQCGACCGGVLDSNLLPLELLVQLVPMDILFLIHHYKESQTSIASFPPWSLQLGPKSPIVLKCKSSYVSYFLKNLLIRFSLIFFNLQTKRRRSSAVVSIFDRNSKGVHILNWNVKK